MGVIANFYLWLCVIVLLIGPLVAPWVEDTTKKKIKHFDPDNARERPNWAGDLVVTYEENSAVQWGGNTAKRVKEVSGVVVPLNPWGRLRFAPNDITGFFNGRPTFSHNQLLNRGHVIAMSLGGADLPDNIVPQYSEWQTPGLGAWGDLEQEIRRYTMSKYGWGDYAPQYSQLAHFGIVESKRRVTLKWTMTYDDNFMRGKVPIIYGGRYGCSDNNYYAVSFPSTEINNGFPRLKQKHHKTVVQQQGSGDKLPKIPTYLQKGTDEKYETHEKALNQRMMKTEEKLKRKIKKNDLTDNEAAQMQALQKRRKWWANRYIWNIIYDQVDALWRAIRRLQIFVGKFKYADKLSVNTKQQFWDPLETFVKDIKKQCPGAYKYYDKPDIDKLAVLVTKLGSEIFKVWQAYYSQPDVYKQFLAHIAQLKLGKSARAKQIKKIIKHNRVKVYKYSRLKPKNPPIMTRPEFDELVELRLSVPKLTTWSTNPLNAAKSDHIQNELKEKEERLAFLEEKFIRLQKWRMVKSQVRAPLKGQHVNTDQTDAHVAPQNQMDMSLMKDYFDEYDENPVFEEYLLELYHPNFRNKNSESDTDDTSNTYGFEDVHVYNMLDNYGNEGMITIAMVMIFGCMMGIMGCVGFVIGGFAAYVISTYKENVLLKTNTCD